MIPTLPTLRKIKPYRICLSTAGFPLYSGSFFSQIFSMVPAFALAGGIVCLAHIDYSIAAVQMQTGNSSVLESPSVGSPVFEDTNGTITIRTPAQTVSPETHQPENYFIEPKIILPYGPLPFPQDSPKNYGKTP